MSDAAAPVTVSTEIGKSIRDGLRARPTGKPGRGRVTGGRGVRVTSHESESRRQFKSESRSESTVTVTGPGPGAAEPRRRRRAAESVSLSEPDSRLQGSVALGSSLTPSTGSWQAY